MGRDGSGVRPASANSIEITFQYQGRRCRERLALQPSPDNLEKAARFRSAVVASIAAGSFDYAASFPDSKNVVAPKLKDAKTLGVYLPAWLETKRPTVKLSTFDGYRKITNMIVRELGHMFLTEITRGEVKAWLAKHPTVGNKAIKNWLSVLRSALDDAVQEEAIEHNPLHAWGYSREKQVTVENIDDFDDENVVDPFTLDEITRILAGCRHPQFRNLIHFMFATGLRTSEAIALQWRDLDFERGEIRVNKAITRAASRKGAVETTKTTSGRRIVKMLDQARTALEAQRQHTQLAGGEVFQNPVTGRRYSGDQPIRNHFMAATKKAGVRYRRPYQTRHTYASMLLSAGESPMWVAKQMGHSDWGMIRRIYGRWIADAEPKAGASAERMMSRIASS